MNLVKEKQGGLVPTGLKRWPFKFIKHFADATGVSQSPAGPSPAGLSTLIRLGKSLKATIIASFSYNGFKWLANWSLEDMFFGNIFKSRRVAPSPFHTTHENI